VYGVPRRPVEPETLSVELDGAGLEAERPGGSVRAAAPEKGEPDGRPNREE
jgi:hypothetical protein